VVGQSMEPNFKNGDYLIVDEISYRFREIKRGEVIVFKSPQNPSIRLIKRVIGLPNETIEIKDGKIKIIKDNEVKILDEKDYFDRFIYTAGDVKLTLKDDEYYVLGDNRSHSADSRFLGPINKKLIIGRVFIRALPLGSFKLEK
jgi:signal peptidase I